MFSAVSAMTKVWLGICARASLIDPLINKQVIATIAVLDNLNQLTNLSRPTKT